MLAQGVAHLVSNHGRKLVVAHLQLVDEAGVDGHLAARHAPGIHLVRREHVGFPRPLRGVLAEGGGLRDQAVDDRLDARHLRRILVERALLLRVGHHLRVCLLRLGIDLLRRQRHALVSLDADGAGFRGVDGLATGHQHGGQGKG